ncbi:MAG: alpha/beta hydrolase, partial [Chloroflexi bacterium]|nr:alpha/beta hydrolase [Chloroflexota bacterium]
ISMQATVGDIKLAYSDEGRGTPLVFIHGFPLSRATWQKQVDALQANYRVIAPDLRGLGESEGAGTVHTMAQFAADIHALLAQLNSGPVVLAGHSMGGYVALAFARHYPDRLRGLVLVGTKAGADSPEAAAGRRATAEKVQAQGSAVVVDAMAPRMLSAKNTDAQMAARVRQIMAASRPQGVIAALHGMAERPDSTELLAQIVAPTLVVTGADDVIIPPAESHKLAEAIKGARLEIIPDAGHLVALEKPEAFNRALLAWLKSAGL